MRGIFSSTSLPTALSSMSRLAVTMAGTPLAHGGFAGRMASCPQQRQLSPLRSPTGRPLAIRRTWARLIRKIYGVDPLPYPRRGANMRVIAVIDQEEVIYRILSHP